MFSKPSAEAESRLADVELLHQFAEVENFSDKDKEAVKTVLSAMITKHKVHLAVR